MILNISNSATDVPVKHGIALLHDNSFRHLQDKGGYARVTNNNEYEHIIIVKMRINCIVKTKNSTFLF